MIKSRAAKLLWGLAADFIGTIFMAVGINSFIAPNHIAPGGASGLAVLINYMSGLPIGIMIFVVNLPLFILAWKYLGRQFIYKTVRSTIILTISVDYLTKWIPIYDGNDMLAALFGGVLMGAGLSIVFMNGSTTGGTDIAGKLFRLRYPHISMGQIMLVVDLFIVTLSAIVYKNIESALYAVILLYASSKVIDAFLYGIDVGKMVLIVSEESDEIAKKISKVLQRGVTVLYGKGVYSNDKKEILLAAVKRSEFSKLKSCIYSVDPRAFVIVADAGQVLGEGFKDPSKKEI